jgi:hypothetical protein
MVVGAEFIANLNADKIYIDLTYLSDPITHKFWLTIQNQSLSTLYFKIISNITNWSLDTPADGKLGATGSGATSTETITITRANPGSETTDSGSLKIEAYTDSGYTNKIGEATLSVTVYIEDLENWTDVTKSDFDDGTAQGWTLSNLTINNAYSVEAGGYSAVRISATGGTATTYLSKSVSLPNRNKVRIAFFLAGKGTYSYAIHDIAVYVDGTKVFDIPFSISAAGVQIGWIKFIADLSAYKGETKTLKVEAKIYTQAGVVSFIAFDRIVVAGKD